MKGDPRWIKASKPMMCVRCGADIPKGRDAFFYPNNGATFCDTERCGKAAAADFEAHRVDEDGF